MADKEKSMPEAKPDRRLEVSPADHAQDRKAASREDRLAAALRENLRRRKDQKSATKPARNSAEDPVQDPD